MKKGYITITFLFVTFCAHAQTSQKKTTSTKTTSTTSSSRNLKASMERGKTVYTNFCLGCHQADGAGVPNMNPPLIKTKWVLGDKKQLITIMLKGMDEPIEINDEEFHNPMPPNAHLTDQEIADVLTYVRNSFGNKASAVSSTEVKGVRAKVK